ncbi:MAG: RimK/LysX family protein [Polyangia bacterium]
MAVELPARGVRVGGVTVGPGEARAVSIPLGPRGGDGAPARAVPAWVAVGGRPGPRVSVVAALRGTEVSAARAASRLAARLDPAALAGSVVVVPVLRPSGRMATAGRPRASLPFPGESGGERAARDAFSLFADVVIGAQALIVLGAPARGRRGLLVARVSPDDPRARWLAVQSGAALVLDRPPRPGTIAAAAAAVQVAVVELSAAWDPADGAAVDPLANGARAVLGALGVLIDAAPPPVREARPAAPSAGSHLVRVRAPRDGYLETLVPPGNLVRPREALARLEPMLPGPAAAILAPSGGMVIEVAPAGPVRAGSTVVALVRGAGAVARKRAAALAGESAGSISDGKTRVGWVELVALPGLGVDRLKAKIDTGARTSALHVTRMRTVDTTAGPNRRPILEITVPGGGRGRRPTVVRVTVRSYAMVRDTSGRIERRPVIETALKLGTLHRRITVTLTNRGDMLYPMLVGRTALGAAVAVDPSRRYLLGRR